MKKVTVTTASAKVIGHFDGVENGLAVGWAFNPAKPEQRLQVEILCDGEVVAFGIADRFREDLVPAGLGDGKHLFRLPLSYELLDGNMHVLTAREAYTGTQLYGGKVSFGPVTREINIKLINRLQGLSLLKRILQQPEYTAHASRANTYAKLYRLGALAQETGRFQDARYVWESLQTAIGSNVLCYCKLGEIYLLEGNASAALKAYNSAAAADLSVHWAHLGIAQARLQLNDYAEAEQALEIAIALRPNDLPLQNQLEEIKARALPLRIDRLLADGHRDEALCLLKQALVTTPENKLAKDKLSEILMQAIEGEPNVPSKLPGLDKLREYRKTVCLLEFFIEEASTPSRTSPQQSIHKRAILKHSA